jgi:hypothetical protein
VQYCSCAQEADSPTHTQQNQAKSPIVFTKMLTIFTKLMPSVQAESFATNSHGGKLWTCCSFYINILLKHGVRGLPFS